MSKEIWSFLEIENGKLHDIASKMATEAKRDSNLFKAIPCGVFIGPSQSISLLEEVKNYGLEKIYYIETDSYPSPEILAENLCELARKRLPELMLFASTPLGAELGARVAARLRKGFLSGCVDFEFKGGNLVVRKSLHGGKAYGYFSWIGDPPYIATINLGSLEKVEADKKTEPEIVQEEFKESITKTNFEKAWKVPLSELEITEARLVIGVGGGVDRKEFMDDVDDLARLLEGVIGGSRVAVFRNYISVERQIGTTGKAIGADIYIPIGISGATRHTVSIKDVKHVLPINKDKEAPIFKFAELGIVGDLYEVVPDIIEILNKSNSLRG